MNKIIIDFIESQTCASICYIDQQGKPYCFSCYYAIDVVEGMLFFKSSPHTQHSISMNYNAAVSGTILPDKLNILSTKGIQFTGEVILSDEVSTITPSTYYHNKFPLAHIIPGNVYTIRLEQIKMTDSSLGFGKKTIWNRTKEPSLY